MKNYSIENLNENLAKIDWTKIMLCDSVNQAWDMFKTHVTTVIDKVAPIKEVRLKQRSEPWITSEILESIRKRDKLFHEFKKSRKVAIYSEFKKIRNKTQKMVHSAKSNYFSSKVEENKNKPKKLWESLKALGPSNKSKAKTSNIGLNIDGNICFDKPKVAEKFNMFFTSVASALVEKLPTGTGEYGEKFIREYYKNSVPEGGFILQLVTEEDITKMLLNINMGKATGLDNLPAKFLKDGSRFLAPPITHIINLTLHHGKIPQDIKDARVVPLYKKSDKTEPGNYRPVSVLTIVSKILERAVYDQVESYLKNNNLLYKLQSGFRSCFSTDTCLMYLTDYIKMEMGKGNYTGMVMLDLQKAFDTVDHKILLYKLSAMGMSQKTVKWFEDYLTGRTQLVAVGEILSKPCKITCGVPQGSILGPLLFLIYVNDMPAATNCELLLYADDSALLVSDTNVDNIQNTLGKELESVSSWLVDNKLSLHLGKTESILFGSKRKLNKHSSLKVVCNGNDVVAKKSVKYLGAELEQTLSGEAMGELVIKKANSRLKFLHRNARNFDIKTKKLLTSALVQCHFDYACSSWYSGLSKKTKSKLQVTENRLIRFILGLHPRTHIGAEEFNLVGLLTVDQRVAQIKLSHAHRILNGKAPEYLQNIYTRVNNIHSYNTRRSSKSLHVPRVNGMAQKTFMYTSVLQWNLIPPGIQGISELAPFKNAVKKYFLGRLSEQENTVYVYY
jgi:hypothetical protein